MHNGFPFKNQRKKTNFLIANVPARLFTSFDHSEEKNYKKDR